MALRLLEEKEKFSLDDVIGLKFNTRMLLADRVKPALRVLGEWDNRVAADSRGGVLFQRFWDTYSQGRAALFANHQLRPIWFSEDEIKAHLEREYHP